MIIPSGVVVTASININRQYDSGFDFLFTILDFMRPGITNFPVLYLIKATGMVDAKTSPDIFKNDPTIRLNAVMLPS
jgi:hypothetical protein